MRRTAQWLTTWIMAVTVAVAWTAGAGEPLVRPGDRIAVFGDGISTGKGYGFLAVELMNRDRPELKLTWIDQGHPGWTAELAPAGVPQLLAEKPALVTVMFGTEDLEKEGARGVAGIRERLRQLVQPLRKAGVRVVLLTPPYASCDTVRGAEMDRASLPRMAEEVLALGKEEDVPVFDMFTAMRLAEAKVRAADPAFQMFMARGDTQPNAIGNKIMARALANFLLGKSAPPRVPFVWKAPGAPVASVVRVERLPDAAFALAPPLVLDRKEQIAEPQRWRGAADLSAPAFAARDATNLYLLVDVVDDVVMPGPKPPAWDYDGIEFFFDARPAEKRDVAYAPGYFQILVGVPAAGDTAPVTCGSMDKLDAKTIQATCRRTSMGYTLRVTIPWPQLKFKPVLGATLGFDFVIHDKDAAAEPCYKAFWRGAGDDDVNAGSLGVLKFE